MSWLTRTIIRTILGLQLTTLAVAVPAVTIPELIGADSSGLPFVQGWQFTTNSAISVTRLGVFDSSQDGLVEGHDVGIFSTAGVLVAFANIPAGVAAPLINQFRSVAIAPVLLPAGQTFRIGALFTSAADTFVGVPATLTADPAINFIDSRFVLSLTLIDPIGVGASNGRFGPNFDFTPPATGAPELNRHFVAPVASLLLLLGATHRRRAGLHSRRSSVG